MADIELGKNPAALRWQAPTENEDGSAISGALDYTLYRKDPGSSDPYVNFMVIVGDLQVDGTYSAPLPQFPEGSHEIVLTAKDEQGDESAFSNSVSFTIGIAPKAPTFL